MMNRAFLEACTPGYYNNEGQFQDAVGSFPSESYAPGADAFNALLARWREAGDMEGLEVAG
jgi:cyclohexanone monooxygenase